MESTESIDKQIVSYLDKLTTRQKETLLTVAKAFAEEQEDDIWQNKEFIAEMDRRFVEYEKGEVKGVTLDELVTKARSSYHAKNAS